MCEQVNPSGRFLVKLAIFLVICCFAESATGSCIRYGHACWGGHGKRSHHDPKPEHPNLNINKNEALLNDDARWFLAKLLQTNDNRLTMKEQIDENQSEDPKIDYRTDDSSNILNDPEQLIAINDLFNDKLRVIKYLKSMEKTT